MGAPGLAFETWDPSNQFLLETPTRRLVIQPPNKIVILSEALRISIANRELHGAESKDPGDACWQMLLRAFRPRTTIDHPNENLGAVNFQRWLTKHRDRSFWEER
jgi:hypothetical protein